MAAVGGTATGAPAGVIAMPGGVRHGVMAVGAMPVASRWGYGRWGYGGMALGAAASYPYSYGYYGSAYPSGCYGSGNYGNYGYSGSGNYGYSGAGYSAPVANEGYYCATSEKTCLLNEPGWLGTGCSCKVPGGRARGIVE